ncbi:unnamed protein product [Notodromas monacha]|uniref:Uncharacterized protein n=1 Tax=Notodromas monacha TaxID=399045 RepID=A0A7R9BT09_9CRUS|nr:unnamed protein product [Notodromas monacha]CAG0920119.1 unnamed protein product [Notodromas monacha]
MAGKGKRSDSDTRDRRVFNKQPWVRKGFQSYVDPGFDRTGELSDARCGTTETGGRTEDPRDKAEQDPPTNLSCAAEEGVALGSCVADGRRLPWRLEAGLRILGTRLNKTRLLTFRVQQRKAWLWGAALLMGGDFLEGREGGRIARLLERAALRVGCPRKSQVSSRSIVLTTKRMGIESKATFAYKQRHLHINFISHHSSLLGAYSGHVCTANALESERSRCGVMDRALSMGT